jgi:hypothetical protein
VFSGTWVSDPLPGFSLSRDHSEPDNARCEANCPETQEVRQSRLHLGRRFALLLSGVVSVVCCICTRTSACLGEALGEKEEANDTYERVRSLRKLARTACLQGDSRCRRKASPFLLPPVLTIILDSLGLSFGCSNLRRGGCNGEIPRTDINAMADV